MSNPIFAISVRQPWAWALIHGGKDVENRTKAPQGTGNLIGRRFCIHASKGMTQAEYEHAADFMATVGIECPRPDRLIRGGVIGSVRLDHVTSEYPSRWFFGPRGLIVREPQSCDPVAASGQLGWFKWKPSGVLEEPKPWMMKWPNQTVQRAVENAPLPLWEHQP